MNSNGVRLFVSLFFLIFLFGACSGTKGLGDAKLKKRSSRFLLKQLVENQIDADWFSAKAKIAYEDAYNRLTLSSNIRMRKDSVIWMNFKKLSVEAARVLITPDSIYVIDRINNQYTIKDLSFLQNQYQLPATFETLQNLILGNPVFFTTELDAEIVEQQYKLSGSSDRFASAYLMNGFTYVLEGLLLEDYREGRSLIAELGDYQEIEDTGNFSYFRNIGLLADGNEEVSLQMELSKVEINIPKSIKFEIPERYNRID